MSTGLAWNQLSLARKNGLHVVANSRILVPVKDDVLHGTPGLFLLSYARFVHWEGASMMLQWPNRTTLRPVPALPRMARTILCAAFFLTLPLSSHALTSHGTVSNVDYTLYAPDWTWQNREVNILVVLRRTDDNPQPVTVILVFPPGKAEDFAYKGKTEMTTVLQDSSRVRDAFVGIKPLSSAPRQVYPFQIRLQTAGGEAAVDYPLRTIRGAAVNPGLLAVFLPAGVAAAWCIVLLVALIKMAAPGAWLTPSPPASEPEAPEAWITRNPN